MRRTRSGGWAALAVCALMVWGCGGGGGGGGGGTPPPEKITVSSNAPLNCVRTMPFTATLLASGAKGTVTWSVTSGQLPSGLTLDKATGTISGTPTPDAVGVTATIAASDATASGAAAFTFYVYDKLAINPVTAQTAHTNIPYSLAISTQGGVGFTTGWSISAGQLPPGLTLAVNPPFGTISGIPTQAGSYTFTIQANDTALSLTATADITIVVDTKLTITKSQLKDGEQGQPYSDSFTAVNATTALTWSITGQLPPGLALNATTGTVSGTPTGMGQFFYSVSVSDANVPARSDTALQTAMTIVGPLQAQATTLNAYVGVYYSEPLSVSGGFPPYTWSLVSGSLPPGITFASGGYVYGTTTQLGAFSFVVQVTDSAAPPVTVTQTETLNVTPTPVNVSNAVLSPAPVNVLYHSQIPTSGGTPPYTFDITSGTLPPGLTLDAATGYIDGTPTQVGTYNFMARATDSSNPVQTGTMNEFIVIQKGLGRNDSIATATPIGNNGTGQVSISPYIDPINAATPNPDTDYYKLIGTAGNTVHVETYAERYSTNTRLDTVIELVDANGTRLANCGAPTFAASCLSDDLDATTHDSALDYKVPGTAGAQTTFYVHVLDWSGDARPDMSYTLNVSGAVDPLKIQGAPVTGATVGTNISEQFSSSGGTGAVTWAIDSGTLPPGLSLSPTGLLAGTVTTDGTYAFTIRVTDSGNPAQVAKAAYTMVIADPVAITSSATLPNACVNQPYTFMVTATGGVPPLNFSGGFDLPFTFDQTGKLSGTPTTPGTFGILFILRDSAYPASVASQTTTLTVVNCP